MQKHTLLLVFLLLVTNSWSQDLKKILIKAYTSSDSSDYYFQVAKKIIKTPADEGEFYFCKNARHVDYGSSDSAVYYGKIAIDKLKKVNNFNSLFTVYNNLSKVYNKRGKYDEAIKIVFEGLRLAEHEKKENWIAFFNNTLSLNYHDFENYQLGVLHGKKALKYHLGKKNPDIASLYSTLNAIAINYDDWNKPNEALHYHKMVFNYIKGKDTLTISSTYNNIGNTLLKQKKYVEAEKWINRAVKIVEYNARESKDESYYYEQATHYTNLATIASELNEIERAEKLFKQAEFFSRKSNNAEKLRDYYFQKLQFSKKRNNLSETIKDQDNYIKLRDSVYKIESAQAIAEVEAKYENEKKAKALLLAKNKLIEEEIAHGQKTILLYGISLFALFSIIIGFLIYRQQKLKNTQQKQEFELKNAIAEIELQNKLHEQRLAISRDLHDNIGAQLTFIISSIDNLKFGFPNLEQRISSRLSVISNFTQMTIVELRDTIWAMNVNQISFSNLSSRIYNFIEKAKSVKENIQFSFIIPEHLNQKKFSSLVGINLYRTIQEGINNAIKYANADEIAVEVKEFKDFISIEIKDNGIGFNLDQVELGNGLINMQKRIEEIGGNYSLHSTLGNGTTIQIHLKNEE